MNCPMIFTLPEDIARQLVAYALQQAPKEACGLLLRSLTNRIEGFEPFRNYSPRPLEAFQLCEHCVSSVVATFPCQVVLWHSHPVSSHRPSVADLAIIRQTGLPMAILSLQGQARTFAIYEPVPESHSNGAVREAFKVHLGALDQEPVHAD